MNPLAIFRRLIYRLGAAALEVVDLATTALIVTAGLVFYLAILALCITGCLLIWQ